MLRVPGTLRGESLARAKSLGARVEVVYSPMDAISLARENAGDEVVFLGIGFETTAPGTAAAILAAEEEKLSNFSVFPTLKMVEPALRALLAEKDFSVSGFLCPGHVASVIGARGFSFLAEEYSLPCVVGGFEPREILIAVAKLISQLEAGEARLENAYPEAVRNEGNPIAVRIMEKVFTSRSDIWRGLSEIDSSGLGIREEFAQFDAEKKFGIKYSLDNKKTACRCGDVICGRITPHECPMFGKVCTPENPEGPCMVSGEGACAAAYKYSEV
jgi:hydrogenase expression/formation protein HypD